MKGLSSCCALFLKGFVFQKRPRCILLHNPQIQELLRWLHNCGVCVLEGAIWSFKATLFVDVELSKEGYNRLCDLHQTQLS